MMYGNCKCFHHWVTKLLILFAWISAIAFWLSEWRGTTVWGKESAHWFQDVVIVSLLAFGTVFCGCCGKGGKMMAGGMCKHEAGCSCNDCDKCRM